MTAGVIAAARKPLTGGGPLSERIAAHYDAGV